jgi:3-hydroxy-5-methyl-1-naphthoate 3-O-methyltransferase
MDKVLIPMQPKPTTPTGQPPVTPERLMQFAFGYAAPLMLEAAIRHRVFDLLDAGPKTLDELSTATGASPRGLRILLNGLVGLELLAKDAQGRYLLRPESSTFLVSTKPGYRGGSFKHASSQLIPKWLKLTDIVRTGKPAIAVNQEAEGSPFFLEFVEDLFPMGYATARMLGEHLNIPKATKPLSVLDLAAGSGVWSIALAQQSPHVRVTAVDWPGVLPATRRTAERNGVADRFRFVAGDLSDADFGVGHQIATLGHILHSEGETRSRALLKKTFAALAPGGTIVIAEWLVNDERTGPAPGLMFAVNMLVNTDQGDTFSFNEIRRWLEEAGFRDARTLETPSVSPLVLATKPAAR